jgi:hypothetical protein
LSPRSIDWSDINAVAQCLTPAGAFNLPFQPLRGGPARLDVGALFDDLLGEPALVLNHAGVVALKLGTECCEFRSAGRFDRGGPGDEQ